MSTPPMTSHSSNDKSSLIGYFYWGNLRPQAQILGMRLAKARLLPSLTNISREVIILHRIRTDTLCPHHQ